MRFRTFDVIVIGAGPAGEVLACKLAEAGKSVAVIEAELVGGECSYYAACPPRRCCVPRRRLPRRGASQGAAQAATGELDVAAILARRDEIISDLDDSGQLSWLHSRGATLIRGHGRRLDGERRVRVGDDVLQARRAVVVATGSAAAIPPVPRTRGARAVDQPADHHSRIGARRLIVLDGGVVGVEMADAFTSFGAHVMLVEPAVPSSGLPGRAHPPRGQPRRCRRSAAGLHRRGPRRDRRPADRALPRLEDGRRFRESLTL